MTENLTFDLLKEKINSLESENSELKHKNIELKERLHELNQGIEADSACEDRFKAMLENSPFAIIYADKDGRITSINNKAEMLFGAKRERLIGFSYKDLNNNDLKKAISMALTGEKSSFEGEFHTPSGNRLTNLNAIFCPTFHNDGMVSGVIAIFEDISERVHLEIERDRLICELRSALSKVRTLSGFVPICASCKKIRDDKGFWTQVEEYVHEHSDIEFSHGICPACMRKLYPGELIR